MTSEDTHPSANTQPKPKKNPKRKAIIYLGVFLCSIVLLGLLFSGGGNSGRNKSKDRNATGQSSKGNKESTTSARPLVPVNSQPSSAVVAHLFQVQQRTGTAAAHRQSSGSTGPGARRKNRYIPTTIIGTGASGRKITGAPQVSTVNAMARTSPIVAISGGGDKSASGGGEQSRAIGFANKLPRAGNALNQIKALMQSLPHPKGMGGEGQDRQAAYQQFLKQSASRENTGGGNQAIPINPPMSGYVLTAGSIIPAVLVTTINSDLPGMIVARVRQNVYDSIHESKLVIPMGSTLVGYYGSKVFAGQTRVLSSFDQIIFPDGATVNLKGMSASDSYGQSGMNADVNNHYLEMFGASFLIAALSTMLPSTSSHVTVIGGGGGAGALGSAGGSALNQVSRKALSRAINIPPTLIVHRGFRFNVMVNRPIRLGYSGGRY